MKTIIKLLHTIRMMLPLGVCLVMGAPVQAAQAEKPAETAPPVVNSAVMCESVQDGRPVNKSIVFTVSNTSVYCWSDFDPVTEDGYIYHEWYRKGVLITRKKLAVHSPRWATFSSLPLRQPDIGPWQLKITDETGNVLKTLRFSITE